MTGAATFGSALACGAITVEAFCSTLATGAVIEEVFCSTLAAVTATGAFEAAALGSTLDGSEALVAGAIEATTGFFRSVAAFGGTTAYDTFTAYTGAAMLVLAGFAYAIDAVATGAFAGTVTFGSVLTGTDVAWAVVVATTGFLSSFLGSSFLSFFPPKKLILKLYIFEFNNYLKTFLNIIALIS